MKNANLKSSGIEAAKLFLNKKGYKIIDMIDDFIVAIDKENDNDTIAFITVDVIEDIENGFPTKLKFNRSYVEHAMTEWLFSSSNDNKISNCPIRFDEISILVSNENNQTFLRHHINALEAN